MQFFTIPVLAIFAAGSIAMPNGWVETRDLETRVDCGQILPACNGGKVVGQTNYRCSGQISACDLWTCPGGAPNAMVCGQEGSGCVWI